MKRTSRYPFSISVLHWVLAAALIVNLILGLMLDDDFDLIALHKSIGIAILALVLTRLINRLRLRRQLPASINAHGTLPHLVERIVHFLLYATMLAIPILGWLKTNAAGHAASFFGTFSLPTLVAKSHALSHWLGMLHAAAAYGLAALVGLHVAGALIHALMRRENVLSRISPLRAGTASADARV